MCARICLYAMLASQVHWNLFSLSFSHSRPLACFTNKRNKKFMKEISSATDNDFFQTTAFSRYTLYTLFVVPDVYSLRRRSATRSGSVLSVINWNCRHFWQCKRTNTWLDPIGCVSALWQSSIARQSLTSAAVTFLSPQVRAGRSLEYQNVFVQRLLLPQHSNEPLIEIDSRPMARVGWTKIL